MMKKLNKKSQDFALSQGGKVIWWAIALIVVVAVVALLFNVMRAKASTPLSPIA